MHQVSSNTTIREKLHLLDHDVPKEEEDPTPDSELHSSMIKMEDPVIVEDEDMYAF